MAILMARRYNKKHNVPSWRKITDEEVRKAYEENENRNYDVYSVDEKLRKGLNIEKIDLPNCGAWYVSLDKNPKNKVLYYIHGGGFVAGSSRDTFGFISYAVKHFGYNIFSIDYRLAPNHKCLETIEDCFDGYKYLLRDRNPKDIILIGDSAGGNLVFALPQKLKDEKIELPGGIISCSPVTQFIHYPYSYYECSMKTDYGITFGINDTADFYRGELDRSHPYVSPLLGDLSDYPPTYLDASNRESLRDESRMMYVLLKEQGGYVEYHELRDFFHAMLTSYKHGFVRREEYPLIINFINKVFNNKIDN